MIDIDFDLRKFVQYMIGIEQFNNYNLLFLANLAVFCGGN